MQGRFPTGVDRVSLEYVKHFGSRSSGLIRYAGQWLELSRKDSEQLFDALLAPNEAFNYLVKQAVVRSMLKSVIHRRCASRILFHTGHSGLERSNYIPRLQRSGLKPFFFVHDLIPITHPEYCRPGEAQRHKVRVDTMLSSGRGIIANSAATLAELNAYVDLNGLPSVPAVVALLAPARLPLPSFNLPLNKPYFVMLGTIEPRKNHWIILHLWRQLIESLGDGAPRLVIIGQRGWECENVVDLLDRCDALRGFVIEQSRCTDTQLSTWLHHAQALLFPSFAEGYGMPLVEALSVGLPVIVNDLPAFREIAGDIPEYVDALDGVRWKALILAYAKSDHPKRVAQLERLQHFIVPTWDAHFEQVERLLADVND
jgi:glycosyltransferase involved in cell wall biosynthesis